MPRSTIPSRRSDPAARYLLVRPRGGLNDCLVQIHRCRRYAAAHDRTLLLDLSYGAMRLPFGELFHPLDDVPCRMQTADEALLAAIDEPGEVGPAFLAGRLVRFESRWNAQIGNYADETGRRVTFDMGRDHPERCLVHEQCGGGLTGALGLAGLALAPAIAAEITQRLAPLGDDYDALHVRHSDYRTDFHRLFARARPMFLGRRLLICTDSAEVQQVARSFFPPAIELVTTSDIPDRGGLPLHYVAEQDAHGTPDARAAVVDQFCDLIAMAHAQRYLFTTIDHKLAVISGYSALVEGLRTAPAIRDRLLALAPSEPRHSVPALAPLPLSLRAARAAGRFAELLWNRRARRRRRKVQRQVRQGK